LERCAGIDIGKRFVVACLMVGSASETPRVEQRKFGVTVDALESLREWLEQERVTHVVLESTGSYWKPVFNILEKSLTVVLANPVHVKNLRGHKTDMKVCPAKAGVFSGRKSHQGKSQKLCSLDSRAEGN
jgi:transposase